MKLPYRIDIAGTWIDQPYVSKYGAGSAIVASIEPTIEFMKRGGLSTSTREKAKILYPEGIPTDRPYIHSAEVLFRYDNPPGQGHVSGSQDSLGIVLPGINRIDYGSEEYWISSHENISDAETIEWMENIMHLVPLWERPDGYDVLADTQINKDNVAKLTTAASLCWDAIKRRDLKEFSEQYKESFNSQVTMFPHMMNERIQKEIDKYKDKALGWKLSGAGGGGYLMLVSEEPIEGAIKIRIRRG